MSTLGSNPDTTPPLPRPRRRGRTLLLALLVFLAGAVFGGAVTVVVIVRQARQIIQHPDAFADRLTARLARRLSLDDAQRARVHDTLAAHQGNLKAIRADVQPRLEAELRSIHADVRTELNSTQQMKWDRMYEDLTRNWLPPMPAPIPSQAPSPATTRP